MADLFSFAGRSIVAPGILMQSNVGSSQLFQLLPNGVLAFFGGSAGGNGNGTVYTFQSLAVAQRLLRSGPLLNAINNAGRIGGATGFVAVVIGAKTNAALTVTGVGSASATFTSGDQGVWTNSISVEFIAGSASGTVAALFSYPDSNGNIVYIGGQGTSFDDLTSFRALQAAMLANTLMTPPASTGLPPVVTMTINADGQPSQLATTLLTGGTGDGSATPNFAQVKAGIDATISTPFDIGHLVGVYDEASQAYADEQATMLAPYGNLRRWIHQVQVPAASAANSIVTNSEAVANAGIAQANMINSIRSSVVCQQIGYQNPNTGVVGFSDVAPFLCGMAALLGATATWGPASPLTFEYIPGALGIDYAVLANTGDRDLAISNGVWLIEQVGTGGNASVRVIQSVTTAPSNENGAPWIFSEFSVVRVSDAVLANIKVAVTESAPKTIGGGNTVATMNSILADVRDVLEDALEDGWITSFDPASISIYTTGQTGMDDIVNYDMAPTLPLNHLGINQNLLPFSASVALSGQVNG